MTADEAAFWRAVKLAPKDPDLPLVFADWLDEQNDPRGPWMRDPLVRRWLRAGETDPLPRLLAALSGSRASAAVKALARIGAPAVPALIALARQSDDSLDFMSAYHALDALRSMGQAALPALPVLGDWLRRADPLDRGDILEVILSIGPGIDALLPEVFRNIGALEGQDTTSVQAKLLAGVGPAVVPFLRSLVRQSNESIRVEGAVALSLFDPASAAPILAELTDGDAYRGEEFLAVYADAKSLAPELAALVHRLAGSTDETVRRQAVRLLRQCGVAFRCRSLAEGLADPDSIERQRALQALAGRRVSAADRKLVFAALADPMPAVRAAAITTIRPGAGFTWAESWPAIASLLVERDASARLGVVAIANRFPLDDDTLAVLATGMTDRSAAVRNEACNALLCAGSKRGEVLELLLGRLHSGPKKDSLRWQLLTAVMGWSRVPIRCADAIRQIVGHAVPEVRMVALRLLGRIRPRPTDVPALFKQMATGDTNANVRRIATELLDSPKPQRGQS